MRLFLNFGNFDRAIVTVYSQQVTASIGRAQTRNHCMVAVALMTIGDLYKRLAAWTVQEERKRISCRG